MTARQRDQGLILSQIRQAHIQPSVPRLFILRPPGRTVRAVWPCAKRRPWDRIGYARGFREFHLKNSECAVKPARNRQGGGVMTQTQTPQNEPETPSLEVDLDPKLIKQLAGVARKAEKPNEPEPAKVSSWFYSVPCAGVRYYTYHEHPSPAK